jgi:hypothetical protein
MKRPELVPANNGHFDDLGETLKRGGRAIAAVLDGRTIGVAGYYLDNGRVVVFSTITPELRKFRRTIVKGAQIVMGMTLNVNAPAHALIEPETEGSETLLKHFGFEQMDGNIFGRAPWRRQVH